MTPAARYAAAITILDVIQSGELAEKAITGWGRQNRYAGSKDRAAVRDHVFDVLRTKRSCELKGGGATGRNLILGHLRNEEIDPETVFLGDKYAPTKLSDSEKRLPNISPTLAESHDLPDWAWIKWIEALGSQASSSAQSQRTRAPVSLRVNLRSSTRTNAAAALATEEIGTVAHSDVSTCLFVTCNHRRVSQSRAFLDGLIELQDASSQSAVAQLALADDVRVLDYCAGGGGKSLAIADQYNVAISAYDIAPKRMNDIPKRAARSGVEIDVLSTEALEKSQKFDVVFCDAPCSGSGTWRRTPDAKWRLSEKEFAKFPEIQKQVVESGSKHVRPGGLLIYATCSVFHDENSRVVSEFLAENEKYTVEQESQIAPSDIFDGFYFCAMKLSL